ncbi:MAG: tetratricopeptide repeat protein [Nitrospirae bacterium YQR-1]
MPKQIKKKTVKHTKQGEELKGTLHEISSFYERQKKEIHIAAGILAFLLLATVAVIGYMKYTAAEAENLKMTGFANYYSPPGADRPERLKTALDAFVRSNSLKPSPLTMLYIASCNYELGKQDEAVKLLVDLNLKYAQNNEILPLSYLKLFNIYRERKDFEKALETVKALYALRTSIYKDVALNEWAMLLTEMGKAQEGKDKYEELKKNYPNSPYVMKDTDNPMLSGTEESPLTLDDIKAPEPAPETRSDNKTVEKPQSDNKTVVKSQSDNVTVKPKPKPKTDDKKVKSKQNHHDKKKTKE